MLPDGLCQFSHAEADGRQIVAGSHFDLLGLGLHDGQSGIDRVLHVDHGQSGLLAHEALVLSA